MVASMALHNMRQDRNEPIRAYGARLRGQASVCKFTQQCTGCTANVDCTEAMIKDVLCRGLADTEIQMQLLGDKNQDMMLEQVLRFVEAKEAGKRSASHAPATVTGNGRSNGRRDLRPKAHQQSMRRPACTVGSEGMEETPQQKSQENRMPSLRYQMQPLRQRLSHREGVKEQTWCEASERHRTRRRNI